MTRTEKVLAEVFDAFESSCDKVGEYHTIDHVTQVRYAREPPTSLPHVIVMCKDTGKVFKLSCEEIQIEDLSEEEHSNYLTCVQYAEEDDEKLWKEFVN